MRQAGIEFQQGRVRQKGDKIVMSDYRIKIIPNNPHACIEPQKIRNAVSFLRERTLPEDISVVTQDTPMFVDCGENLEEIKCPLCGEKIDFDWWGEAMGRAAESGFADLRITMPCCHENGNLNELNYHFPCGFACVVIEILNPTVGLDAEHLKLLQELFGDAVRVIHSRL